MSPQNSRAGACHACLHSDEGRELESLDGALCDAQAGGAVFGVLLVVPLEEGHLPAGASAAGGG